MTRRAPSRIYSRRTSVHCASQSFRGPAITDCDTVPLQLMKSYRTPFAGPCVPLCSNGLSTVTDCRGDECAWWWCAAEVLGDPATNKAIW